MADSPLRWCTSRGSYPSEQTSTSSTFAKSNPWHPSFSTASLHSLLCREPCRKHASDWGRPTLGLQQHERNAKAVKIGGKKKKFLAVFLASFTIKNLVCSRLKRVAVCCLGIFSIWLEHRSNTGMLIQQWKKLADKLAKLYKSKLYWTMFTHVCK